MSLHTGKISAYSTDEYPFAPRIGEALQVQDLSSLHEDASYTLFCRETDQQTVWHDRYYRAFDKDIAPLYFDFLTKIVAPMFDEPMAYQKIPTFRVHLPRNIGVGEFHRDRDYDHPKGETNFLLPLTDAQDTSTIWIESSERANDFRPINLVYGQVFCFDGRNLRHGNKINETGVTRVSFDFRVIPVRLAVNTSGVSINTKTRFCIGDYYFTM
jgi:hypothetical protein